MFYPNHQIRSYCIYLGSLQIGSHKYDMGVYENKKYNTVSHAIVFGEEDSEYKSGEFIFQSEWLPKHFRFQSFLYKINEELYKEYLENPAKFTN